MLLNILSNQKLPDLVRKASILTIKTAISEGTNIMSLKKICSDNPELLEMSMLNLLNYGRASLMIENTSDQQICLANLSIQILNDELNACFTLEEIILCIQNGITGKYGKVYNKLNSEVISTWLDKYYNERMDFIDANHLNLKNSSGNQSDRTSKGNELSDEFDKRVNEAVANRMAGFFRKQNQKSDIQP